MVLWDSVCAYLAADFMGHSKIDYQMKVALNKRKIDMAVNPDEEMKMTYTSVLNKDGKPYISLCFERGSDTCEASVPECIVTNNNGFSDDEVKALEQYLSLNKKQIIENSKNISGLFNILGK